MTEAVGPGSLLECICNRSDDPACDELSSNRLVVGRIYTCTKVVVSTVTGEEGVHVEGADHRPYEGWVLSFFRPVRRPDGDLLKARLFRETASFEGPVRETEKVS